MKTNQIGFVVIVSLHFFNCVSMEEQQIVLKFLEQQAQEHKKRTTAAKKIFEHNNFEYTPAKREFSTQHTVQENQPNKRPRIVIAKKPIASETQLFTKKSKIEIVKEEETKNLPQASLFALSVSTVKLFKDYNAANPTELKQKLVNICQQNKQAYIKKQIDEENSFFFNLKDCSFTIFPTKIDEIPDDQEVCGIKLQ